MGVQWYQKYESSEASLKNPAYVRTGGEEDGAVVSREQRGITAIRGVGKLTGTIHQAAPHHCHYASHAVNHSRVRQSDWKGEARDNHDGCEPISEVQERAASGREGYL